MVVFVEIPVEQQPPQGVSVYDQSGRVINKLSRLGNDVEADHFRVEPRRKEAGRACSLARGDPLLRARSHPLESDQRLTLAPSTLTPKARPIAITRRASQVSPEVVLRGASSAGSSLGSSIKNVLFTGAFIRSPGPLPNLRVGSYFPALTITFFGFLEQIACVRRFRFPKQIALFRLLDW